MSDDTSTPALDAPLPTADADADERFALLDLGDATTPAPLPSWAERVIAVIRAIVVGLTVDSANVAFAALSRAIEPARAYPEGPGKAAVRAAMESKHAEIKAVLAAARAAAAPPPVAPPVASPPPVAATPPVVPPPVAPSAQPRPEHHARWARLPGPPATAPWGALLSDNLGALPGDVVIVHRARGGGVSRRYLVGKAPNGVWAISETAPTASSPTVATLPPPPTVEQAIPVVTDAPSATNGAATNGASFEQALGNIAEEGAAIASSASIGSMAGGERRGVGFADAAGYVQALAQGVKAATAEEYKSTLRSSYGYTDAQIAALTVTILPEIAVVTPGTGETFTPAAGSLGYFDPAARAARAAAQRELKAGKASTRADVRRLLDEGKLIAGAVAAGSMLQVSWVGGGQTTLGKVREALEAIGRVFDAPDAPSAVRHAGRAVEALRNTTWDTMRLPSGDLPDGIKARWLVGRKMNAATVKAGDAYGKAALVVSLTDGGKLMFDGDATLAASVQNTFNASTANEVLKSEDLTAWMGDTLKKRHAAVKRGPVWYVPGGHAEAARQLSETIGKLWGDHERIPVTTGADLMRSLTRGLTDEVKAIEAEFGKLTGEARERAKDKAIKDCAERSLRSTRRGGPAMAQAAIDAEADAAWKRATVSPTIAARLMRELAEVAGRVEGYAMVLGEESTASAKGLIVGLRDQIERLCTDFDQRASMLELY